MTATERNRLVVEELLSQRPPILIGGCGRSGTTLLLSMLSAHPKIFAFPNETAVFVNSKNPFNDIFTKLTRAEREAIADAQPHRYCEKTPSNVLVFDQFLGTNAKLIHIVRDGRDVVTSIHPDHPGRLYVSRERWIADVEKGLACEPHENLLRVRYEDLVLDYPRVMRQICAFLNEEFTPELSLWFEHATVREGPWKDGFQPSTDAHIKRWQRPEYAALMVEFMADEKAVDLLRRLGYIGE